MNDVGLYRCRSGSVDKISFQRHVAMTNLYIYYKLIFKHLSTIIMYISKNFSEVCKHCIGISIKICATQLPVQFKKKMFAVKVLAIHCHREMKYSSDFKLSYQLPNRENCIKVCRDINLLQNFNFKSYPGRTIFFCCFNHIKIW